MTTATFSTDDITILDLDHPGANDSIYRARRNQIAEAATQFRKHGGPLPQMNYTDQEHATWRLVAKRLAPLHEATACKMYLEGRDQLGISTERIPEFTEINEALAPLTGFRILPVEGLVDSASFLSNFENRSMLCTQYMRHHSRPDYTPEPDIIHEVLGHVPAFTNEAFLRFMERVGKAAAVATEEQLNKLDRIYWWTVEYGLIKEEGETKVFGAGILGSFGEMEHAFQVPHLPFQLEHCMSTAFDYTRMQPHLFVIESFEDLLEKTDAFLRDIIGDMQ